MKITKMATLFLTGFCVLFCCAKAFASSADVQNASLHEQVQETVREILSQNIAYYKADGGLALVTDVNTGEVLANVSLPEENKGNKMYDVYEYGSVLKLFTVALGLDTNVITPEDTIDAKNPVVIGKKTFTDHRGQKRDLLVPEVLIHSSNVGAIRIALKAGTDKQKEFLGRFGFFEPFSFGENQKEDIKYPHQEVWPEIVAANVANGFGVMISPIHLMSAVAALVNGGKYHVPSFVKEARENEPARQVISQNTSAVMRHLLWGVQNRFFTKKTVIEKYNIGGKTGTVLMRQNGVYVPEKKLTHFVGVFPMNEPKYAVFVMLENPKPAKHTFGFVSAGWNAHPIGIDIIEKIAPQLGVLPQEKMPVPDYMENAIDATLRSL